MSIGSIVLRCSYQEGHQSASGKGSLSRWSRSELRFTLGKAHLKTNTLKEDADGLQTALSTAEAARHVSLQFFVPSGTSAIPPIHSAVQTAVGPRCHAIFGRQWTSRRIVLEVFVFFVGANPPTKPKFGKLPY